ACRSVRARYVLLQFYLFCLRAFFFLLMAWPPPRSTLFPYTTLFRSSSLDRCPVRSGLGRERTPGPRCRRTAGRMTSRLDIRRVRSEEHTSELQSRENLVCRLLLEKKKPNWISLVNIITKRAEPPPTC